jgi:chromosome segregation ATPase
MSAADQNNAKPEYKTPAHVQAWFLERSRRNWKNKYMTLKADSKRLQNRVNDVTKSREQWRDEARQSERRIEALEDENAKLRQQLAALKKDGPRGTTGSDPR